MKKKVFKSIMLLIAILAILYAIFLFAKIHKLNKEKKIKNKDIFATSTIGNITKKEVNSYLDNLNQIIGQKFEIDKLKKEEKELIAKEIINERIILNQAKHSNIINTDEYKERVKISQEAILKEVFLKNKVESVVTDESIVEKYNELKEYLKDKKEYKIKHILVKSKDDLKNVINFLKNATFEEAAEKFSIDNSTKNNGGELGYVLEDSYFIKSLGEEFIELPIEKLSNPIKTELGWHIIIKEEVRDVKIPELDQVRETIKAALSNEFIKKYTNENIQDKDIKIIE